MYTQKPVFKKYLSKTLLVISSLVLLFFGLILVYTQKRGVFAQEEEMTICVEMVDLDLPGYIRVRDKDKYPLLENEMEVPIGQSVDEIEDIADDILTQLGLLIAAARREAEAAEEMSDLIGQCGKDPYVCDIPSVVCQFVGWDADSCTCDTSSPGSDYCEVADSYCPGGSCPSGGCTNQNAGCSSFGKCSCSCPLSLVGPCGGQCYCDKKPDEDCYCKPKFKCKPCICTCAACPVADSTCPTGCSLTIGEPKCPGDCPDPSPISSDCDPSCAPSCSLDNCPTCPEGIAAFVQKNPDGPIIDSAKKISSAYGQIDDYFVHRFLPATWIKKVQYGDWAKVGTIISVPWTSYNPNTDTWSSYNLDTEQGSKDLCGWLHDNQYDAWEELCITPIGFASTGTFKIEHGEEKGIMGKLDKSRLRLEKCGLAIAEQELLLAPTAEIGCEDILLAIIPISSYLDVSGDPTDLCDTDLCYCVDNNPTRSCKSCHGQFYCEAQNKGYCAEDYFCCH